MAMAALCAEAVGAMAAMQETTVDYLKTRKQFGVTIGSFQACSIAPPKWWLRSSRRAAWRCWRP